MPNMKRGQVGYRPFEGRAVLQDGLLAVARPGGEVQQALANALFGVADTIRPYAEATAVRKGREAGQQAALAGRPTVDIQGGDRGPDSVVAKDTIETTDLMPRKGDGLAPLRFVNGNAIRNKPIQPALASNLRRAVSDVYGAGYTVEVFSGGQEASRKDAKGRELARRTGKKGHDHGGAADVRVYDPDGKRLSGDPLAPLAQYWLANKLGGAGLEMRDGGIHLDIHRPRTWNYADQGGQYTPAQQAAVAAGLRGEQPKVKGGKGGGVKTVIQAAAARHGQPAGLMMEIARLESSGDPTAKNDSGAAGLYQFMPDTAAQYGLDNPFDPAASADAAARFARDNRAYLLTKLKREPTWGELYLAHQQGGGGAAKLLADPAARAVDVVGANAVLQNGGNADMTAGEFAALWTTKIDSRRAGADGKALPYDPGLGAMPTIDLDPAYDIVPGDRSPLSISASGGMPALTGRDTLFGRAHDQVVTETYSARLQDQMLNAVDDLTTKYADDPQGLAGALRELKDQQLGDVPPAVALDYEQAFNRVQRRAVREAQKAHEGKLKQQDEDTWHTSGGGYEEALGRATVALEPGDEDGLQTMAAHAQRLKQHYREGVARGFMTPEAARQKSEAIDADATTNWYVLQARDWQPDEIEDYRETLKQDYADGKLPGGSFKAWQAIDGGLARHEAQQRSKFSAEAHRYGGLIEDDIASMLATGGALTVDGAPLDAGVVRDVLGEAKAADWEARRNLAKETFHAGDGLERMTGEQIEARLEAIEPKSGEVGFANKQATFEAVAKKADGIVKLRREDPALAAEMAFPDVAKIEDPSEKSHRRLNAQAALGVGERLRQPLTNVEARGLADRIEMVEDNPDALQPELEAMMGEVQQTYGTLADDVMVQVFEQRGLGKVTAQLGLGLMRQMNLGVIPRAADIDMYGVARRHDMADKAMAGEQRKVTGWGGGGKGGRRPDAANPNSKAAGRAKAPNAAQLKLLRNNPDLAPQFDAKFGKGAAELFSKERDEPVRRKLADGSIELTYPDGWVETLRPDGSVEGKAAQ